MGLRDIAKPTGSWVRGGGGSCLAADGLGREVAVSPGVDLAVGQTASIVIAVREALETVPGKELGARFPTGATSVLTFHGDDIDRSAADIVVLGTSADRSFMSDDGGHPTQSEQPGDDEQTPDHPLLGSGLPLQISERVLRRRSVRVASSECDSAHGGCAFLSLVVESTLWPQNIENRELTRSSGGWYQVCRRCQCGSISMYYFVV